MSASKACALNLYTTGVLDCVRKGVFIWWEFGAGNLAIQKGFGVEVGPSSGEWCSLGQVLCGRLVLLWTLPCAEPCPWSSLMGWLHFGAGSGLI